MPQSTVPHIYWTDPKDIQTNTIGQGWDGSRRGSGAQRKSENPLPPGPHHRDMPVGLQGGKEGFFPFTLALLPFAPSCKAAWWPKQRTQGCIPSAVERVQRRGPKPEGGQPSPPHVPLLKQSCSSDLQMTGILMFTGESHARACDVHRHGGTLKPGSTLLWIPLDQAALHIGCISTVV